eukprot:67432_1
MASVHFVADDEEDKESLGWVDWVYCHRKQLIIGGLVTSLCIGFGYYIWNKKNQNSEHGSYHDKATNSHLTIDDKMEGKDIQFVNNWFSVSQDVSANKCNKNVYFNGIISHLSTQRDHEPLPPGTMLIMPENWRPKQRTIYDLKDNKSNYNLYMEMDLTDKTDKIEILPSGEVNLMGRSTGWFINLSGCCYEHTSD